MAYKRALWNSGLTYQQTCTKCNSVIRYMDNSLDYRPWYADGFVYCPNCKAVLRHSEHYAIDENGNYINPKPVAPAAPPAPQRVQPVVYQQGAAVQSAAKPIAQQPVAPQPVAPQVDAPQVDAQQIDAPQGDEVRGAFCVKCGKAMNEGDVFCSKCGTKRV